MTITYTLDVSSGRFQDYTRLLLRWHGSVWKSVYRELIAWLIVYAILSVLYRSILNADQKKTFEDLVAYAYHRSDFIPLNFILGFFVTLVVQRWWEMYNYFGWMDNIGLYIGMHIEGTDDRMRMIRRNIIRYVALVQAMVFRDISPVVRRRFPNDEAFQVAGFLTEAERKAMESVVSPHGKYWLPIHWSFHLIKQARLSGNIASDRAVELIQERIREYRTGLAKLRGMHWVPVPLAYAQVVFLATRSYLALSILGAQYIDTDRYPDVSAEIDLYVPVVYILQFIFYLGWMKVAEALLNPFGDDDDDFECNWFIDRNLQMALSAADDAIGKEPPLARDIFWNDTTPVPLYAHGTKNLPIYLQKMSATERTTTYLSKAVRSIFFMCGFKRNKEVDTPVPESNLNEDVFNSIPDSSDQQMFKDECHMGIGHKIFRRFSLSSKGSVSLPRSARHSESNGSAIFPPSGELQHRKLTTVDEQKPNSTVVNIDE